MDAHATDRGISTEILPPRLPVLGSVKIGALEPKSEAEKSGRGWQRPVKLDFFRITTRTRGPDGNYTVDEEVHRRLETDQPTELDVRLPFDTRAHNLYTRMLQYDGRTRVRDCDGDTCLDPRTDTMSACQRRKGASCACKPYARLSVILEAAPTFGGIYVYRTTSWESTATMRTVLDELERDLGSLRGLPMLMKLTPAEVRYRDGKGKERTGTAHKVALVLRASYDEAREQMLEFHRENRIARNQVLQIAGNTMDDLDALEAEEEPYVAQEFFPSPAGQIPEKTGEGRERSQLGKLNDALGGLGPSEEDDVEALVQDLRELLEASTSWKTPLNDEQRVAMEDAIAGRDPGKLRLGIHWMQKQADRAVATDEELTELERWEHVAHERGLVTDDERAAIAQAAATGAGPIVRTWTRTLQQRVRDGADEDDADTPGEG